MKRNKDVQVVKNGCYLSKCPAVAT